MAIVLQKPLGTDVYDIDVFNSNSTIIEKYLNQLTTNDEKGLKVYYYPETSEVFNIDTITESGIHVCDDLLLENLLGTYPDDLAKWYFGVLSFGKDGTSSAQLFFDLHEEGKMYWRSKNKDATAWSAWTGVGSDTGEIVSSNYNIFYYEDPVDVKTLKSGVYLCKAVDILSAGDDDSVLSYYLQASASLNLHAEIIVHGNSDENNFCVQKINLETEVPRVDHTRRMLSFMRYKNPDESGNYVWSSWYGTQNNIQIYKLSSTRISTPFQQLPAGIYLCEGVLVDGDTLPELTEDFMLEVYYVKPYGLVGFEKFTNNSDTSTHNSYYRVSSKITGSTGAYHMSKWVQINNTESKSDVEISVVEL